MPGLIVHVGATVQCSHVGTAQPPSGDPRVSVSGQPVSVLPIQYMVSGCTLPPSSGGPCVSGQWLSGSTRVFAGGKPLVLFDSQSICTPPPTPLRIIATQTRVTAQ